MNNKIKSVLLKFENRGFKAYVVGGFVRDYLLGRASYDVDICTNAKPNEIMEILDISNTSNNYGGVHIKDSLYNYDITTFRKEIKYENRRPVEFEYVNTIEEDIIRRDFTINALYMDLNGNIIDLVDGKKDLEDKIIRSVGDFKTKMVEDPLRMLRAIRFASLLNFKIEDNLYNYISLNKNLINTLSITRKKEELDNIFSNSNKLEGINIIKNLKLMDVLDIKFDKEVNYCEDPLGIWAQIEYTNYEFTKREKKTIDDVRNIIKYAIIDNTTLYEYGLYPCIIAGEILGIDISYISSLYKDLPIYSINDININGKDIESILNIKPSKKIKDILNDIELNILDNNLNNNYEDIKEYILNTWR